jgi:hypothetical protein
MTAQAETPPAPPEISRRIILTTKQKIGLPLIAAIPILALFGVFGEKQDYVSARSGALAIAVEYPSRFRYRQTAPVVVHLQNVGSGVLDSVRLSFDTAYISRFSGVRFEPDVGSAYVVTLSNLLPGERRLVAASLEGDRFGKHRATLSVRSPRDSLSLSWSTFVFP